MIVSSLHMLREAQHNQMNHGQTVVWSDTHTAFQLFSQLSFEKYD